MEIMKILNIFDSRFGSIFDFKEFLVFLLLGFWIIKKRVRRGLKEFIDFLNMFFIKEIYCFYFCLIIIL